MQTDANSCWLVRPEIISKITLLSAKSWFIVMHLRSAFHLRPKCFAGASVPLGLWSETLHLLSVVHYHHRSHTNILRYLSLSFIIYRRWNQLHSKCWASAGISKRCWRFVRELSVVIDVIHINRNSDEYEMLICTNNIVQCSQICTLELYSTLKIGSARFWGNCDKM